MKALKLIVRWIGPDSPMGPAVSGILFGLLALLAIPPGIAFGRWWLSVWGL